MKPVFPAASVEHTASPSVIRSALLRHAALILILALAGCRSDRSHGIAGEWTVELDVVETGTAPGPRAGQRLQGILVIDPRIPDAYERRADSPEWAAFTMGRAYVDRRSSGDSAAGASYEFLPELRDDVFEEALARAGTDGSFEAHLSAGVSHNMISLRGMMSADQVTGRWKSEAYVGEVGARGTFRMRRTRRTAATDSALVRSRRGQREWERNSR
jgi:hypothetical protein